MYLLFRSPTVAGKPNELLIHNLFGAPLDSHWLGGGPSAHRARYLPRSSRCSPSSAGCTPGYWAGRCPRRRRERTVAAGRLSTAA